MVIRIALLHCRADQSQQGEVNAMKGMTKKIEATGAAVEVVDGKTTGKTKHNLAQASLTNSDTEIYQASRRGAPTQKDRDACWALSKMSRWLKWTSRKNRKSTSQETLQSRNSTGWENRPIEKIDQSTNSTSWPINRPYQSTNSIPVDQPYCSTGQPIDQLYRST